MKNKRILATVIAVIGLGALNGCSGNSDNLPLVPITPQSPTYQEIGPFGAADPLAPVKKDGKWGFIDSNGKLVIGAQYSRVLPFSEGLAGVDSNGLWGFININGTTAISPKFSRVIPFSDSLAAARSRAKDQFGFINKLGGYAIQPQFDRALGFSQGLAPVYKGGKWLYINSSGTTVLSTSHYRAYRFTADGLALVRPQQNGKYGFMATDGSLKLPAIYDEAFEFSSGLAPVRFGKSWAYIDKTGKYAIQDTYQFASPFSEGSAAVIQNGKAFYITTTGARLLADTYETATPFVGGKALVKSGGITYYIDKTGKNIGVAQKLAAVSRATSTVGDGSCIVGPGVWNNYQGGFAKFSLVNTDTGQWNIKYTNLQPQSVDNPWLLALIPGGPATLPAPATGAGLSSTQSFMAYVPSMVNTETTDGSKWPHFQMDMASADGKAAITIYNYGIYNAPPDSNAGTPWYDFIKGALDIIKGTLDLADGNIFGGLYDYTTGAYDLISGNDGDTSSGNKMPFGTGTFYVSQLSGTYNGKAMNPLTGNFCGGDSYTISDSINLVVEMSATRATSTPGEIDVKFYKYNTFFAIQSASRFNDWRNPSNGTQYLTGDYANFMGRVFANYADPSDTSFCQSPDKSQGFMQTVMGQMSFMDVYALFNFANNFDQQCGALANTTQTGCEYWAEKFSTNCNSHSLGVNPLAFTRGNQTGSTCSWTVNATNSSGPLTAATSLSGATFSQGNCTGPTASCNFNLTATTGTSGQMNITDGWSTVPVSVQCIVPPLTLNPQNVVRGSQTGGSCSWNITASNPYGPVTAGSLSGVTFSQGNCTGPASSCNFTLNASFGTDGQLNINDGYSTVPMSVKCINQMSLSTQSLYNTTNFSSCRWDVQAYSTVGSISNSPLNGLTIDQGSCVGPQSSCSFSVTMMRNNGGTTQIYDGATRLPLSVQCSSPM